nr:McrC family protein [Micromonospora aurantiaca]
MEHSHGSTLAAGFVFDLNTVFEDWLTTALRHAVETRYGGTVTGQHQMHLDRDRRLPLVRPDITWWHGRQCLAVIDAKYKAPGNTPPRDDIYQLLAYCTTLNLPRGHLVYASAGAESVTYQLMGSGVHIVVHRVDLAAPVTHLHEQIEKVAEAITSVEVASGVSATPTAGPDAAVKDGGYPS